MSEDKAPYTVNPSVWDWTRSVSVNLSTVQWKCWHKGHRYLIWIDHGDFDPDNLFLAATDPSGEDLYQHAYPSLPAAKAACERHYETGR